MRLIFFIFLQAHAAIHVIGDSHSKEFRGIPHCIEHYLGPKTMYRIGKKGFEHLDFSVRKGDALIFAFGEIDARCHIGRQRDLKQRDLDEVIYTLALHYIQKIISTFPNGIPIVYSVTPPTNIVHNPDYPIYGSLEDRVAMTRRLNRTLYSLCQMFHIEFLDVYEEYSDEKGALRVELSDHNVHIDSAWNGPIQKKLFGILEKYPSFNPY